MCGILAILCIRDGAEKLRARALTLASKLRHRGPDWSGIYVSQECILAHERLSIIDVEHGAQPIVNESQTVVLAVNGEIYNYKELRSQLKKKGYKFQTKSDCEVILHLYDDQGPQSVNLLRGMFSYVLYDARKNTFVAARDPIGITPLYMGWGLDGSMWFSSEMKTLLQDCESFREFPPGHIYTSHNDQLTRWYSPEWMVDGYIPSQPLDLVKLREAFEEAVISHMMSDVPYAVLLSGGLDSSLVASIAARHLRQQSAKNANKSLMWWPTLHSFSVGLPGSPDLKAAQVVARFLGTIHHSFTFSLQEGIDALSDVIYYLETYDVTTIRASIPMYLMTRKIRAMGIKMVLSGEGSDEIFGGYLYFHKAPNKQEFHKETVRKLQLLHHYDCLRANKSTSAWGVECRPPFLDTNFLDVAMNIDPQEKMITPTRMEKWILRKAFDTPENPYLPSEILWRQKEQFSDGVGYSWIDGLRAHADKSVTDATFSKASRIYPENTPTSKEAYLYRSIFEKHFAHMSARSTVHFGPSVACSSPAAIEWDASFKSRNDPSGRSVSGVHIAAYEGKKSTNSINNQNAPTSRL